MHRLEQSLPYLQPLGGREQMNNGHYQGCDQPCLSKEIAPLLLTNDLKCCLYLQLHDGLIKEANTPAVPRNWDVKTAHFSADLQFLLTL